MTGVEMDIAQRTPPVARRPVVVPAAALKEEINDSWRLLFGCIGALGGVSTVLYLFTSVVG